MVIGIDVSASGLKSTGTGRYINCLLEQLKLTDNQVRIFPSFYDATFRNKRLKKGALNKKLLGLNRHYYRMFGLTQEMEDSKVDCGIFPNYFVSNNFSKASAIVIHDLSFITHPQFYSRKFAAYYKFQLKQTLKKYPLILTVSEHTKNNICKHLNINQENVFLLQAYSNITKNSNSTKQTQPETPYLLYVGHIEPRKNLLFLVENFINWKNENRINIKLKLVGEIWIKSKEVNYLINKYSNHPDIVFKGYVDEEELDRQYSNAFAFVHTSLEEGFGFPVLEAMSYGLPLLCSNNHAAREISSPLSVAIDPNDSISLLNGLCEIYEKRVNNISHSYNVKYSPELMQNQLSNILDILYSRINKKNYLNPNKLITHEEAIEKTLIYSHLFNGGLKKNDLYKFLFDVKLNKKQFETALANLVYNNRINLINDHISLNYHNINIYKKGEKNSEKKKLKRSLQIIKAIPLISCICFSGGTAHYGIENHDDIDLFIITKPNSIYLVYLTIHVLSKIFELRKQLCANFLIDETCLAINDQHDYYTAHQIVSLIPFKNNEMLNSFRSNNYWVDEFFPNFIHHLLNENQPIKKSGAIYFLLKPVNQILKYFYRFFYRNNLKKDTSGAIKLDEKCVKLYTNDHRIKILDAFNREWKKYMEAKKYVPVTFKVTGTYS
jgi:glycosyltransferase involved in cell wall biosynthesis